MSSVVQARRVQSIQRKSNLNSLVHEVVKTVHSEEMKFVEYYVKYPCKLCIIKKRESFVNADLLDKIFQIMGKEGS